MQLPAGRYTQMRLLLAANTATAEMMEKLDQVKYAMLEEWSRTKRTPKHAAWMHDHSSSQVSAH